MPTPLQILLDPISLVILAMYAGLMLWELLLPATSLAHVAGWHLRSLAVFAVYFIASSYLPLLWDAKLAEWQLLDLTALGTVGGTVVGLVVYEAAVFFWHYALHRFNFLWRAVHQMHHSAERLDTFGAFYFSPLDMLGWTLLGSLCLNLGVGLVPQAVTNILLLTTFFAIFQHANIRTPRWLGYFIQRPERHSVHHEQGVHTRNFSDLPIFDILFGTFDNPREHATELGFYPGASARIVDMLLFRDVTVPPSEHSANPTFAPDGDRHMLHHRG